MRKAILLVVLVVCCSNIIRAQDNERKLEVSGVVSAFAAQNRLTNKDIKTFDGITPEQFRTLTGFELTSNDRFIPAYGFEAAVTRYFTKRVGLTGSFAGFYRHNDNTGFAGVPFRGNHSIYTFMGGPHVRFSNGTRFTPFVRALAGAARTRVNYREVSGTNPVTATDSSTRFAMDFGGGLDLRLSERVSLRLIQLDYNPILGKERRVTASDATSTDVIDLNGRAQSKNFRLSIGIVFK